MLKEVIEWEISLINERLALTDFPEYERRVLDRIAQCVAEHDDEGRLWLINRLVSAYGGYGRDEDKAKKLLEAVIPGSAAKESTVGYLASSALRLKQYDVAERLALSGFDSVEAIVEAIQLGREARMRLLILAMSELERSQGKSLDYPTTLAVQRMSGEQFTAHLLHIYDELCAKYDIHIEADFRAKAEALRKAAEAQKTEQN